ncbi:LamG domain-containing protein, partial [Myxococcota bacterium]|nr:LamG domain-containing protein [Myxococcota bacterium]
GRCDVDCAADVAASLDLTSTATAHGARCSAWPCTGLDARSELCRARDWGAPYWAVFDDAVFEAIAPCFDLACGDFDACVEERVASTFPDCVGLPGACEAGPIEATAGLVTPCHTERPAPSIILLRAVGDVIVDVASGVAVVNKGVRLDSAVARFGESFRFDGGHNRLTIPDIPMLNFEDRDFTIEFWFYPEITGTLIAKRAGGRAYGAFDFFGSIGLYVSSTTGFWDVAYAVPFGWEYRWQHVAMVRHGAKIFVYHDGKSISTMDIGDRALKTVPSDVSIGNELDSSYPFVGNMEEIRIVDGFAVYDGEFAPPVGPF